MYILEEEEFDAHKEKRQEPYVLESELKEEGGGDDPDAGLCEVEQ